MNTEPKQPSAGKRGAGGYPYFPLTSTLRLSDAIKELGGGRVEVQRSILASELKEEEKSATFQQRIMTARVFGLIDGRGAYGLTELSKRYYFPTDESDKSTALLELFNSPPVFRELTRRFDGAKLPRRTILANIAHRELGVPESWKERVAGYFVSSAQAVGIIDSQGFLRYKAALHGGTMKLDEDRIQSQGADHPQPAGSGTAPPPIESDRVSDTAVWQFPGPGGFVRVETSCELSAQAWVKLEKYVQLLKPSESDKKGRQE